MIGHIEIQNFRNIQDLYFKPNRFNVITGLNGTGKTSFLEAIALADSSEQEFHTLLKNSYSEPFRNMELDELIDANFFSHQSQSQESFRVKISTTQAVSRSLEIWRTNDDLSRSLGMVSAKLSPFIFVFGSSDPRRIAPKALQYVKVNSVHKALKNTLEHWPTHFVGHEHANSVSLISRYYRIMKQKVEFWNTIRELLKYSETIQNIEVLSCHNRIDTIYVKLKDRSISSPLYGCPKSIIRLISILVLLHATKKPYILIDDIDRDLEDQDLEWLISQVCRVAITNKLQVFVTSQKQTINDLFEKSLGEWAQQTRCLDLTYLRKIKDPNKVAI